MNKTKEIKTKVTFDDNLIKRFKDFTGELIELCKKYDLQPELAKDTETEDSYITINVKDFIKEEDIKIDIVK